MQNFLIFDNFTDSPYLKPKSPQVLGTNVKKSVVVQS